MNKIPYKVRLWVGIGLILLSMAAFIATFIYGAYSAPIWILIVGPIFAVISFVIGVVFVPRINEDETPIVIEKKSKPNKPKNRKPKKQKKPYISEKEWKELEEEDDEMMFIEEAVEDD